MGRKDEGKTCGFRIIKPGDIPNKKDAEDIRVKFPTSMREAYIK